MSEFFFFHRHANLSKLWKQSLLYSVFCILNYDDGFLLHVILGREKVLDTL